MVERWNAWRSLPSIAAARAAADSAGVGPGRLGGVAHDRPGRAASAAADHPPLHRAEVLCLVDQDVGVAVVVDRVGGRHPDRGAGTVLALPGRAELLAAAPQVAAQEVVELVVLVASVGHVAERVAQLVDERDVLHGQRVVLPRVGEQPLLVGGHQALADPGQELRVAQPAEHLGGAERGPPRQRELHEGVGGEHVVVERLAPTVAAALAAHLPPHHVEQRRTRSAGAGGCAGPGPSAVGAASRADRGRAGSRRRARTPGTPWGSPAPAGATYAASARPSGRSP